jgi:hypothetical protein
MIKIFSVPWHVSHQYELLKLPGIEWTYLINHTREWAEEARPMPNNLKWVTHYEKGKYDLAIIHIDQQCIIPTLGKSQLYRDLRIAVKDIPIIIVNHGTPCYPERVTWDDCKNRMKQLVGDVPMVVNSYQAAKDWGWGQPIIHGLDPDEWWDLPKEPRATTFISQAGIGTKYYGRNLLAEVKNELSSKYGMRHIWIGDMREYTPHFGPKKEVFDNYRDFLGRSLVYFNPTFGSPMPRTRTEAMLSGCCIVTTKEHDAENFIEDGVNGFITKHNPEIAAKIIVDAIRDYKNTVEIGKRGRETAIKLFNKERYQKEWLDLINKTLKI